MSTSIGDRFNPFAGAQLDNPFPFYEEARHEEPVFFSTAFGMWVVTRYDDARSVMANPSLFSSQDSIKPIAPICPDAAAVLATGVPDTHVVVDTDPPGHARWRKVLQAAFSAPRMRRLESQIRDLTDARVDALAGLGHAEAMADFAYPIPLQVIARLFGISDERVPDLKRWGQRYMELVSSVVGPDRQVELAADIVEMQLFFRDHVARLRAHPGEDIVSAMIAADEFSESELVSQTAKLMIAGHETTVNMIANGCYLLLSEPERWRQIVADPSLISAAVEEILRFDAPVPTFLRTATVDVTLAGKKIAQGGRVLVVFASANRDAGQFADPDVFDLHRTDGGAHMAFGHGIHHCVGAPLARLEGRVVFETLAERLPTLRLTPEQQFRHVPQLIFHGFERLDLEWDEQSSGKR